MPNRNWIPIPKSSFIKIRAEMLCPLCKSRIIKKEHNKHFGRCGANNCQTILFFIRPSTYQRQVMNDKNRTLIQVGGFGSSKTFSSAMYWYKHLISISGAVVLAKANDAKQLEQTAKMEMLKFFDEERDFKVKNKDVWVLRSNGSRIIWSAALDQNSIRSLNLTGAWVLEANKEDPDILKQIRARLRNEAAYKFEYDLDGNRITEYDKELESYWYKVVANHTKYIIETNPDYSFVIQDFALRAKNIFYTPSVLLDNLKDKVEKVDSKGRVNFVNSTYSLYLSSTLDNIYIDKDFIKDLLSTMDPREVKQMIYCDFFESEDMIFPNIDSTIVKPYKIDLQNIAETNNRLYFMGTDFGANYGYTTALAGYVNLKDNSINIIDEDRTLGETYEANAEMFLKMKTKYSVAFDMLTNTPASLIRLHIVDRQGNQTQHGDSSIISAYKRKGFDMVYPKNYSILKNSGNAIGIANEMIENGTLTITENCSNLLEEARRFKWARDKMGNKSVPAETMMRRFDMLDTLLIVLVYLRNEDYEKNLKQITERYHPIIAAEKASNVFRMFKRSK